MLVWWFDNARSLFSFSLSLSHSLSDLCCGICHFTLHCLCAYPLRMLSRHTIGCAFTRVCESVWKKLREKKRKRKRNGYFNVYDPHIYNCLFFRISLHLSSCIFLCSFLVSDSIPMTRQRFMTQQCMLLQTTAWPKPHAPFSSTTLTMRCMVISCAAPPTISIEHNTSIYDCLPASLLVFSFLHNFYPSVLLYLYAFFLCSCS